MSIHARLIREISDILVNLNSEINRQNKMGRTHLNYEAEEIYCTVLNIVTGWNLQNVRQFHDNYPAVDLVDEERRVAVQVTSSSDRAKIQHTLDWFYKCDMHTKFDQLIILLVGKRLQYRRPFTVEVGLNFDSNRDIWDEDRLLYIFDGLPLEHLKRLRDYLWSKTTGLGLPEYIINQEDNTQVLYQIISDTTGNSLVIDEVLLRENTIHFGYEYLINT